MIANSYYFIRKSQSAIRLKDQGEVISTLLIYKAEQIPTTTQLQLPTNTVPAGSSFNFINYQIPTVVVCRNERKM